MDETKKQIKTQSALAGKQKIKRQENDGCEKE